MILLKYLKIYLDTDLKIILFGLKIIVEYLNVDKAAKSFRHFSNQF